MKTLFIFGIFALSLAEMRAQSILSPSADVNPNSIQEEHNFLMGKANSFFSTYQSAINARIEKANRLAENGAKDTSAAKSLIKIYQLDSIFCDMIIPKGDSLMQSLLAHGKHVKETMPRGDFSDKLLSENVEKMDKVEFVTGYARKTGETIKGALKHTRGELQKMKNQIAEQIAKEEKAKQKKIAEAEKKKKKAEKKRKSKKTKKRRR